MSSGFSRKLFPQKRSVDSIKRILSDGFLIIIHVRPDFPMLLKPHCLFLSVFKCLDFYFYYRFIQPRKWKNKKTSQRWAINFSFTIKQRKMITISRFVLVQLLIALKSQNDFFFNILIIFLFFWWEGRFCNATVYVISAVCTIPR